MTAYIKNRVKVERAWTDWTLLKNGTPFSKLQNVTLIDASTTRSGETNPFWKSQISKGENATTPFSDEEKTSTVYRPSEYSQDTKLGTRVYTQYGKRVHSDMVQVQSLGLAQSLESETDVHARIAAYNRLTEHFEGFVALGELRETLRMLRNPASSLRRSLDAYIRTARHKRAGIWRKPIPKKKRRKEVQRTIADTYLEWAFGVSPLVDDIAGIFDAISRRIDSPEYHRFRGSGSTDSLWSEVKTSGWQFVSTRITNELHSKCTVTYYGSAKSTLDVSNRIETLGFFPAAIVPAAWELAPWSFLIDYFTNIGAVLNAHAVATRIGFRYCNKTVRFIASNRCTELPYVSPSYAKYTTNGIYYPGMARTVSKRVIRTLSPSGVPLPYFRTDVRFTFGRGLNVAALVAARDADSAFKRKFW